MTAPFVVPTVDISPFVQGGSSDDKARVAEQIDDAARSVGFIQIVGHGIPAEAIDGLAGAIDDFFGLSLAEKKVFRTPALTNRGYSPPKSESLSLSLGVESANKMNDFFEAFNVGEDYDRSAVAGYPANSYPENLWPAVDGFETRVTAYYDEARRVAQTLTRIFARALDLPESYFVDRADRPMSMMRMNNYALQPGMDVLLDGELRGMGEHTDFDIVTVLWADQVAGLQVLGKDGSWNDVQPADGALLVNLGDSIARWTNDRWVSTLHRVKPPVVDGTIRRRRSAAFFFDANYETVIEAFPSCVEPGSLPLHEPISVGAHIMEKLSGSRGGKKNENAERDADRVRAAVAASAVSSTSLVESTGTDHA